MVFWDKRNEPPVPEILRDKTPEQVAEQLKQAETLQQQIADATKRQQETEARYAQQQQQFEQMQQRLQQMEQVSQQQAQTPPLPSDTDSIWSDPDKYIENKLNQATLPSLYSGMLTAKMYAVNQLGPRDKKIFTKYEKEIDKMSESLTPQQRVLPQSWLMLLTMVKGQHDQEIATAESSRTDFFAESGHTGVEPPPAEPLPDKLTEDEETVCRVMHWDRDGYLKQKKAAQLRQSDRGGYMHFGTEEIEANRSARRG